MITGEGAITVKVALFPAASTSPDVLDAVRLTPLSMVLYITPDITTLFVPAKMVPDNVPLKAPVPDRYDNVTSVLAKTF